MRILLLSLAVALSACASTAATTTTARTAAPAVQTPSPPPTSRPAQLLAAAGRPNAPTQAEIERTFGRADITRHDGAGVALTYRLNSCALLLVFAANAQNEMRLSDAHATAIQSGGASPSMDQCAAEAAARHPS